MSSANQLKRFTNCSLDPGLYILRYVSANDSASPVADLQILSGLIEFVHAPGRQQGSLPTPGTSVVLVVKQSAMMRVELSPGRPGGDMAAEFSLDLLDRGIGALAQAAESTTVPHEISPIDLSSVTIAAHVSRLGDVTVRSGEWIAGPQKPLPIEGLCIMGLGSGDTVGVAIQTRSMQNLESWSPWYRPETFAGTRQRAEALSGLRLKLVGALSSQYELVGEALFLSAPIASQRGEILEFLGSDPLVGLRISLVQTSRRSGENTQDNTDRVKIYRAR